MKKISLLLALIVFSSGSGISQAQDLEMPSGVVVRMTNCTITDDRFSFEDVVMRARGLDFGENSPNNLQFRRPIYTSQGYQENWDLQIAAYYSSYTEMVDRRVASGDDSYGRLPLVCDGAMVVKNIVINQNAIDEETAMTTRRCTLSEGSSTRSAYNRFRAAATNISEAGNDTLLQLWLPGMGGPLDRNFDFIIANVGLTRQGLTELEDMLREGFRAIPAEINAGFSCDRPSLWATSRIYQAD